MRLSGSERRCERSIRTDQRQKYDKSACRASLYDSIVEFCERVNTLWIKKESCNFLFK